MGKNGVRPSQTRAWTEISNPPLSEWILNAVSSMGFSKMTPVQASAIPLFLGNKDVVVEAVTGSGKTLAFVIPIVERLLKAEEPVKKHHIGSIIISPTRELAMQIFGVVKGLLEFHAPSALAVNPEIAAEQASTTVADSDGPALRIIPQLLIGGSKTTAQDLSFFLKQSPNLLISTPGRLLELLSSQYVHCSQSHFDCLVLDEADRLLDMGFKDDLQKILNRLPKQRRTGLFSASVTDAVSEIVRAGLRNPVKVVVKVRGILENGEEMEKRTPASLQMAYVLSPPEKKIATLLDILKSTSPPPQKTIIYLSSCAAVDYYSHILPFLFTEYVSRDESQGLSLVPLHGKHTPSVRQKNFARFVESVSPTVLLTTDLAARGLDIPEVDLVVQLDPPNDSKAFMHRSGRAGRAGRRGLSILFLQPGAEEDYIPFLEVRQTPVVLYTGLTDPFSDAENEKILQRIRDLNLSDRAIHEKGQRAFVSWVQSYNKHQAKSIFRLSNLDWQQLGLGWGLLILPKMPELKEWEGDRYLGMKGEIDISTISYKDKIREKQRLADLESGESLRKHSEKVDKIKKRKLKNAAWSVQTGQEEVREVRKDKRAKKREALANEKMSEDQRKEKEEVKGLIEEIKRRRLNEKIAAKKEGQAKSAGDVVMGGTA